MNGEGVPLSGEEDLNDLFENAPCGYVSALPSGIITKANRTFATWLGCEPSEIVNRHFHDLLPIAGKIYYETHFAPLLRMQGFFNEVALEVVKSDGTRLPTLVNAVERRDEAGDVQFIRITIFNAADRRRYEQELLKARAAAELANEQLKDLNATLEARVAEEVQERLKIEEALRQSQKMEAVGQLTGGIAHDFNNLLQVIVGSLDSLQRNLPEDAVRLKRSANNAMSGAKRAAVLVHRLLAFARRQPLDPKPIDVNALTREMSELLHRSLGETIELETVLSARLWQVEADASQLESAIINLAVNARDAMPGGGRLTIETSNAYLDESYAAANAEVKPGQYVLIAVSDAGTGMDKATVEKVFEPFFTTKEVGKGTGLGLSQVYGFVKQSGGHISVYSELGVGTTFRIYLPRYHGTSAATEIVPSDGAPGGTPKETILVVEDDPDVRAYSVEALRELGYRVFEAPDADTALDVLRTITPPLNLLFTDVVLPGNKTGAVLAREASDFQPGLKVLFATGYTKNAVVHHGRLDPGVHLLTKPFTYTTLAGKVRDVLDS